MLSLSTFAGVVVDDDRCQYNTSGSDDYNAAVVDSRTAVRPVDDIKSGAIECIVTVTACDLQSSITSELSTYVNQTRSSADADNGLDAFVGQSRSKNILNPFQVK